MTCRVVCISHATGAGGAEVGRLAAEQLSFLYVDEEIVARAAARGGLEPGEVADEERRKSLAARILSALAESGEAAALGMAPPYGTSDEPSSEDIRALIRETIAQTASRGNVVISAHAASHALDRRPDILRVLVTASTATRTTRLAEAQRIESSKAAREISAADAGRRDYLKRFHDVSEELPTHYDVVVNTDTLSVEDAADVVVCAARRLVD